MKQIVPIAKQSKKAQREHHAKQRGSWNGVNPVTRAVPSGKAYSRTKVKSEARSLISYDGDKERATGAFLGC